MSGQSILAIKTAARQAIHDRLSFVVTYTDDHGRNGRSVDLNVRWHGKINNQGEAPGAAYAEVIEGIDRLIFDRGQLAALNVTLHRKGVVLFPAEMGNIDWTLETQEPDDGPVNRSWIVARGNDSE